MQLTDNKSAEHILTFCSRNPEIQEMIFDITIKCRSYGITLGAKWMSREEEEMKRADASLRGPWFPAQEFSLEEPIMALIKANCR